MFHGQPQRPKISEMIEFFFQATSDHESKGLTLNQPLLYIPAPTAPLFHGRDRDENKALTEPPHGRTTAFSELDVATDSYQDRHVLP